MGIAFSVYAEKITYLVWIIIPDVQILCYFIILLLITYPMSFILAKLISNVGMTDNGPNECSFFT